MIALDTNILVYARREETSHHARAREILKHGNLAYDAHIAALIDEHGVNELWTADRDFARFPGIACATRLTRKTDIRFLSGAIKTCQDSA